MSTGYDYQDKPGIAPGTIPNPDLAWERNKNFNVGFDTRLFERLSFSFDYYNRLTTDLLQDVPTSMTVGFTSALKNVGLTVALRLTLVMIFSSTRLFSGLPV